MTRSVSPKRSPKPSRPAYVLEEQVGFILRQVWQRHATIFAREIGIKSHADAMGGAGKTHRDRTVLAESRSDG